MPSTDGCVRSCISLLLAASTLGACVDRQSSEALELQRRQVEALERAERENERRAREEAAQRAREQAARELRARREEAVRRYARQAGEQIMAAMDGGQDLVVRYGEWRFDESTRRFEIPVAVSFNGNIIRSNNYRVDGVLTVGENGAQPRFARTWENRTFREYESNMRALVLTAAGLVVLSEMTGGNEAPRR